MIPILLRLGPITIYSYGLMMALGFIAADIACTSEFKRHGFKGEWASTLILWTAISGVAGSRIYDIIDNWHHYAANPVADGSVGRRLRLVRGAGGRSRRQLYRCPPLPDTAGRCWLDMAAPGAGDWPCHRPHRMPAFGRRRLGHGLQPALGDGFSEGDRRMDWPHRAGAQQWQPLVAAPGCTDTGCAPWVRVHPAPVYETILYTGVFLVLWAIRKRVRIDGQLFYLYLIMAGALPVPGRVHQGQSARAVGIVRSAADRPYDGR